MFILECASLTHDIGIKKGEKLYNRNDGKIQEQLGPEEAERIMKSLDFQQEIKPRSLLQYLKLVVVRMCQQLL